MYLVKYYDIKFRIFQEVENVKIILLFPMIKTKSECLKKKNTNIIF